MAIQKAKVIADGTIPHALAAAGDANANIFSKSQQRRFGSEVEVVDGLGKLVDIIYSGEELTQTTEEVKSDIDVVNGEGSLETGIITRSSIRFSNEDVSKVTTEKLIVNLKG